MEVRFKLNGKQVSAEVSGDTILLDVLRNLGCYSVKCGCETTNCGLVQSGSMENPDFPARFWQQGSRGRK